MQGEKEGAKSGSGEKEAETCQGFFTANIRFLDLEARKWDKVVKANVTTAIKTK